TQRARLVFTGWPRRSLGREATRGCRKAICGRRTFRSPSNSQVLLLLRSPDIEDSSGPPNSSSKCKRQGASPPVTWYCHCGSKFTGRRAPFRWCATNKKTPRSCRGLACECVQFGLAEESFTPSGIRGRRCEV